MTPIAFGAARRSATALSTPPLIATAIRPGAGAAVNDGRDRVRERVGGERLAGDGGGLEQRQADERPLEAGRVGLDDPIVVDEQPDGGVVVAARGVADQLEPGHSGGYRQSADAPSRLGSRE